MALPAEMELSGVRVVFEPGFYREEEMMNEAQVCLVCRVGNSATPPATLTL